MRIATLSAVRHASEQNFAFHLARIIMSRGIGLEQWRQFLMVSP